MKKRDTQLQSQAEARDEQDAVYRLLLKELDTLKREGRLLQSERDGALEQKKRLQHTQQELQNRLHSSEAELRQRLGELSTMSARLRLLEEAREDLASECESNASTVSRLHELQRANEDLAAEAAACRLREGEMMQLTGQLTQNNSERSRRVDIYRQPLMRAPLRRSR